jgi:transglutaminase-like putative cysteine protease
MIYRASHITSYTYEDAVSTCHSEVRLIPRARANQHVQSSRIHIEPEPAVFTVRMDYFGNHVHHFSILEAHASLIVKATSLVEVTAPSVVDPALTPPWEDVRDHIRAYPDAAALEAFEFTCESGFVTVSPDFAAYARQSFTTRRPLLEAALDLCARIHRDFKYKPSSTTIDTPVSEVFRTREGVCQDFAHLMIAALRSLGLAARYVSGYLRSGANYTGAEASHAWLSIFLPPSGWVDLDPTNNLIPGEGHVTVAWGRDYGDVTPVKGVTLGGGEHKIEVEVRVRPLADPHPAA